MADQDVEGVVYTDHSGDDQRRDQQQQQTLDLNATTNEATGSGNVNTDSRGIQNGQPPRNPIQGNRQSAFDHIGAGGPTQRPFGRTAPGTFSHAAKPRPGGIPDPSLAPHPEGPNDLNPPPQARRTQRPQTPPPPEGDASQQFKQQRLLLEKGPQQTSEDLQAIQKN
ncbi:hypothetical protein PIB30_074688 [Stylosanthes scabra]|uniref:Uncharacterized protein n=1 Tax=Stylosanthes scabra TaxID=79078 RepID=A0ABU6RPV7_9FABA|nr:hypothetical protein [Stylosanthes scabra]